MSKTSKLEPVKRTAPSTATLRQVYVLSGNLCAFSGCKAIMINEKGKLVGEVCHIEAAGKSGARFNSKMTNEERAKFANLMLMCHRHHVETDDEAEFPVSRMRLMKKRHEQRFAAPEQILSAAFEDSTTNAKPRMPSRCRAFFKVMKNTMYDDEELLRDVHEFTKRIQNAPLEVRGFVSTAVERDYRVNKGAMQGIDIRRACLAEDMRQALGLSLPLFKSLCEQADKYDLASIDEIFADSGEFFFVVGGAGTETLMRALAAFGAKRSVPLRTFFVDLDFTSLDRSRI